MHMCAHRDPFKQQPGSNLQGRSLAWGQDMQLQGEGGGRHRGKGAGP